MAIQTLKISLAHRDMSSRAECDVALWQKCYYGQIVRTHQSFIEKRINPRALSSTKIVPPAARGSAPN